MIGWLRAIFVRRPDVGLQLHARQFGTKPPNASAYDYEKAVAAKRRAEARAKKMQAAQVQRAKPSVERPRLRQVK